MKRRQRRRAAPPREESWFGAMVAPDTGASGFAADSRLDDGWRDAEAPDSRFLSRQARRLVGAGAGAFGRIYAAFVGARVVLGLALLLAQLATATPGGRLGLALELLCAAYAVQVVGVWIVERTRTRPGREPMLRLNARQWLASVGTDVLSFSLLHVFGGTSGLNYVPLLVLPALMAGVLTPRRTALATAAGITLLLLATAAFGVAGSDSVLPLAQAGLAGIGFFVITLLTGELAGRLAREEQTARGSLELARQQAQLNRLVIEEMQDGVLVVDRKGRVRAANPSARTLLVAGGDGPAAPFPLAADEAWLPLVQAVESAFAEGGWPESGRDVRLQFAPGLSRSLRLRVRFTRRRDQPGEEEMCVLFLEDLRAVQARTRQEKLAAMGRVSAGIAHEIRNPLAAIAQANALLAEDATDPAQVQLTRMVSENVERLKRIVDDVMHVAPAHPQAPQAIDAVAQTAAIAADWARTAQVALGENGALVLELPGEPLGVAFDAEHLRRVLVNLLDNARRHGGAAPGAIALELRPRDEREAALSVASGGAPIDAETERFLFEPFFSTRSRGTGLGLYICRELCQRYGGNIDYRQRAAGERLRNEFIVTLRRAPLPASHGSESRSLFA